MRLLFVLPEYPPHHGGGIATFYEALLPALVELGHDVDVLLGSAFVHGGAQYQHRGVSVRYLDSSRGDRFAASFRHYEAMPELRRALAAAWAMHEQAGEGAGYDCIEVVDWGLLFAPWAVRSRAPVVVQMHGSMGQIDFREPSPAAAAQGHVSRLIEAGLLRGAAALHTHSTMNQREWEGITGRVVRLLPPPLERGDPPPVASKRVDGLVVGRIQYWKGPIVLCEALRLLGDDAPAVRWVGRDMPYGEHASMSAYLGAAFPDVWGATAEPVGLATPEEVARMQAEAGFVLVPSVWDVYNLTAVEAMRQGAVVVCSTGAGAVDLIEDGVNGFTHPVDDAAALAAVIQRVRALSEAERVAVSEAARATVLDQLAPQTVAAQKVLAYEAVVADDRRVAPDPWANAAASPAQVPPPALAFLDHQPLRGLIEYTVRRVRDKLPSPFRS